MSRAASPAEIRRLEQQTEQLGRTGLYDAVIELQERRARVQDLS